MKSSQHKNPGNFANNRERAAIAGRKGGQSSKGKTNPAKSAPTQARKVAQTPSAPSKKFHYRPSSK